MNNRLAIVASFCLAPLFMQAQNRDVELADSILKYQMKSGGWPKNQDWLKGANQKEMRECRMSGVGSTIDNGATVNELKAIAKACDRLVEASTVGFQRTDDKEINKRLKKYRDSFNRGLAYLLKMQYSNGGWPQFYPERKKAPYSVHITFNDNAMVNVLNLLNAIANEAPEYKNVEVPRPLQRESKKAFDLGVKCILNCQIRVDASGRILQYGTEEWNNGIRTVWCQQHHKETLAPVNARAFELASYTGEGETVDIIKLLMNIEYKTDDVQLAIKGAIEWLENHAIKDKMREDFVTPDGKKDYRLVTVKDAPLLWARYYDLENAEPMFCDRDGVPKKDISEIGYERRNGYRWFSDSPAKLIEKYYKLQKKQK